MSADDGTVFVKDGEGEREVGQFPDASKEEALALYARRYLDLKAKLDLFANKLKSNNVKSREIDETIKTLSAETEQPAVVGDLAALKAQFEALKEEGAAKKTALTEARKAAIAKAVEERTAIVEKAEALADSLDENTNWRSTADKFRSLFQQWQEHQRTTSASTRKMRTPCGLVSPRPAPSSISPAASGCRTVTKSVIPPSPPRKPSSPRPRRCRIPPLGLKPPASSPS